MTKLTRVDGRPVKASVARSSGTSRANPAASAADGQKEKAVDRFEAVSSAVKGAKTASLQPLALDRNPGQAITAKRSDEYDVQFAHARSLRTYDNDPVQPRPAPVRDAGELRVVWNTIDHMKANGERMYHQPEPFLLSRSMTDLKGFIRDGQSSLTPAEAAVLDFGMVASNYLSPTTKFALDHNPHFRDGDRVEVTFSKRAGYFVTDPVLAPVTRRGIVIDQGRGVLTVSDDDKLSIVPLDAMCPYRWNSNFETSLVASSNARVLASAYEDGRDTP